MKSTNLINPCARPGQPGYGELVPPTPVTDDIESFVERHEQSFPIETASEFDGGAE